MDLTEAELTISEYPCFRDLFVRRLRRGARPVDPAPDVIVSPVDGVLTTSGAVESGTLVQAKGIEYSVAELVGDARLGRELEGGMFFTLYLRPKDYHRIHSPFRGAVASVRLLNGGLFPVKPYMVRNLPDLMVRNERLVVLLETGAGRMVVVCIAAAGVGTIARGVDGVTSVDGELAEKVALDKGAELAAFNLGSTVILLVESNQGTAVPLPPGREIRMGQALARIGHLAQA
jgi:phosphatidylserine decarboxylase